jgi:hypothetical protein
MKKLLYIFTSVVLFLFAAMGNAYAVGNEFRNERYAFGATALMFSVVILITYLVWKKRTKTTMSQHAAKFRIKTFEVINHGKRMVITKRVNVEPAKK